MISSSRASFRRRCRIVCLRLVPAALLLSIAGYARAAEESLARFVPASVGFFVEVSDAADFLTTLTDPQIWSALAEFAGQPARAEDAEEWRRQVLKTIKMSPDEAIRTLFAHRVAFVGDAPGRAQDAVVVCRPPRGTSIPDLLVRFQAQRLPEPQHPPTYQLYGNTGVAEIDGLLVFGDLLPQSGLFRRMVTAAGAAAAPRLADDPLYRSLLRRVPGNVDGVVFARLRGDPSESPAPPPVSQPASQPASAPSPTLESVLPEPPGRWRGARGLMVGIRREASLLRLTLVNDAPAARAGSARPPMRLIADAPGDCLAAWEGWVDYPGVVDAIGRLPARNVLRMAIELAQGGQIAPRLAAELTGPTCLAVGAARRTEPGDTPPGPALAWVAAVRSAEDAEAEWHALVDSAVAAYNVLSLNNRDVPPLPRSEDVAFDGVPGSQLDLSSLLPARFKAALGELHLCWTIHDGVLIVATSTDWLRRIVAARRGRSPTLAPTLHVAGWKPERENVLVIDGAAVSDLATAWLDYLRATAPQVMSESWWRKNQPGGGAQRLGIDVTDDPLRMAVRAVAAGSPADGWLLPGDVVRGANSKRFATSQPWREFREGFHRRPSGGFFDVIVERGADTRVIRVPIPFFDGVQALRRAAAIGTVARRVVYFDDASDPAGPRGSLTIEIRDAAPAKGPPASAEATSPTPG